MTETERHEAEIRAILKMAGAEPIKKEEKVEGKAEKKPAEKTKKTEKK